MAKHLFLSSMHPNQNFKQWYYKPLRELYGDAITFRDILDFENNESKAIEREGVAFSHLKFQNVFKELDLAVVNKQYISNLLNYDADIIHFHADSHFRMFVFPETIFELRKNYKCIGYLGDCFMNFGINRYWLHMFDSIRTIDPERLIDYKKIRDDVYWQKIGINEEIFDEFHEDKEYDILFIGRPYGNRAAILEHIVTKLPSIKLALFGAEEWGKNKVLAPYYKGYVTNQDFYKAISKAKISLGLMEGPDGKTPHFNAKVFDSALKNVLVISTYYDILVNEYGLIENEDIIFYHDFDDCIEKIEYYLSSDEEREKISYHLNQKMKNFSMQDILKKMFIYFENNPIYPFPISEENIVLFLDQSQNISPEIMLTYRYVVIKSNAVADKYLPNLLSAWHKDGLLGDINIADIAAPGLYLNYTLPASFDSIIYSSPFFVKHKKILLCRNIFIKFGFFLRHKAKIVLLRVLLFRKNQLTAAEQIVAMGVDLLKKIKNSRILK